MAWLVAGRKFGYKEFNFDADFYGWMAGEVEKFWTDCIIGGREPLPSDVDDVLLKYPRHVDGKVAEAGVELAEDCRELKGIKEELAMLDGWKKELEAAIKMAMGDAEVLALPGSTEPLATWKAGKGKDCFDEKRFAAEHPGLYGSYRYTKPGSRMFLLK